MLKRQRPATPPPLSLGDPPLLPPDSLVRPLQAADLSQHRAKRQRTRPPPLDGALRGWLESKPTSLHGESDGEEDWTEDPSDAAASPSHPSAATDEYKDTNSLLHELHVLHQHRLLFACSPRDQCSDPACHIHIGGPPTLEARSDGPPHYPTLLQPGHGGPHSHSCSPSPAEEKDLIEEVQHVRHRYEDVNRVLGSLFLSRRREVGGSFR